MKPTSDRIIVLPDPIVEVTKGGIIVPEEAKEKPNQGTVISVADGRLCPCCGESVISVTVKPGDRVMYPKFVAAPIMVDGKECDIMRESDIFGVL